VVDDDGPPRAVSMNLNEMESPDVCSRVVYFFFCNVLLFLDKRIIDNRLIGDDLPLELSDRLWCVLDFSESK